MASRNLTLKRTLTGHPPVFLPLGKTTPNSSVICLKECFSYAVLYQPVFFCHHLLDVDYTMRGAKMDVIFGKLTFYKEKKLQT